MRLLQWNNRLLSLTPDLSDDDQIPAYAILSHSWGEDGDEVIFSDLQHGVEQYQHKGGYRKLEFCAEQARKDNIKYFWVDTCCINKANLSELSEAITSMYRWYHKAQKCYVYLPDVTLTGRSQSELEASFHSSRWFTRGWTLQELLAPRIVEFYSSEGMLIGTKDALALQIYQSTTIPLKALQGVPLSQFSVVERIRWREKRQTKKQEDQAYCLLGIFGVFMPLIYGEGDNALRRLEKEINEKHGADVTFFPKHVPNTKSLGLCLNSAPIIKPSEFIGRDSEIDEIHRALRQDIESVEQRRVVLGGIGGIGKTQLAIAYARQFQLKYTSVLWLNATSESNLHATLRSIAGSFINADEIERLNNEQTFTRVCEWLSRPDNKEWLLIFDNYDEPDLFDLDNFCPSVGHGSIIVTTRLPDLVTGQQVRVQPLQDIQNSLAILQTRSGRKNVQTDSGAQLLAHRLDGLPLALVSAGAFLRRSTLTFQQYLNAYEQRWQIDPRRPLRLQEYQDRTLYTTWNLSYTRLKAEDPDAAWMLQVLAYFDNQEVWYELLSKGVSDDLPEWLQASLNQEIDFESVMGRLVDYCLVEVQIDSRSYTLHNCVHDWILGELNKEVNPGLYWFAFDCVANSITRDDIDALGHLKYTRISRHAVRLTHHHFEACEELKDVTHERLDAGPWIARMLREQVQLLAAQRIYVRALAGIEQIYGPDHTSALRTANNLGLVYADLGKLDAAEQMYLRALAGHERTLGLEHASTLGILHNLANLYTDQGKLDQAEDFYKRALDGREKALGLIDPFTLETVKDLGLLYTDQGRLDLAEQMYLRSLAGYEQVLGQEHPSTLDTLHNLGLLYTDQGRLDEAERMYLQALAGYEQAFGPDHVSALGTVRSLGSLYTAQGKSNEAEQMYQRALLAYQTILDSNISSSAVVRGYVSVLCKCIAAASDASIALNQLVRLIEIVKDLGSADLLNMQHLGKALVFVKDDKNAQTAYQFSVRRVDDNHADFSGTCCDGCRCQITVQTGLHVCRRCPNIDLCDQCMAKYADDTLGLMTCSRDSFFSIDMSRLRTFETVIPGAKSTAASWLAEMSRQYKENTSSGGRQTEDNAKFGN